MDEAALRDQRLTGRPQADLPACEIEMAGGGAAHPGAPAKIEIAECALVFEHGERHALSPLRDVRFDTDDMITTSVGRTHQIGFDRNQYTVPWRLAGQRVLVRGDDERVRVLLGHKEVCSHTRSWSVGALIRDEVIG